MKIRTAMILVFLLTFTLVIGLPFAQAAEQGPQELAQYIPEEAVIFAGIRTDSAYLDQLDAIASVGAGQLSSLGLPPTSLRELLETALMEEGLSLNDIFAWLGGYAAMATGDTNGETFQIIAQITDRAATIAFLESNMEADYSTETQGAFTVYSVATDDTRVAIGDSLLLVTSGPEVLNRVIALVNGDGASLAESARFAAAMDSLTATTYNIVAYADVTALQAADAAAGLTEASPVDFAGTLSAGFTIIDTYSLVADFAFVPDNGSMMTATAIDPAFAQYFPADASATVQTANLAATINMLLELLDSTATDVAQPPSAELTQTLAMFGFDLEADILSWTDGDYGAFLRTDLMGLLAAFNAGEFGELINFVDAGLVIEATDPVAAQGFAEKLTGVISMMGSQLGVEMTQRQMAGVNVTQITIPLPLDPNIPLELTIAMGASDEIFFLGTTNAVESILRSGDSLADNPTYQGASKLFLNNAGSIWYTDGEGFISSVGGVTVGALALLGSAIGNVFEGVISELESGVYAPQDAQFQTVQLDADPMTQALELLPIAIEFIHSSTISTAVTDNDAVQVRLTITYQE